MIVKLRQGSVVAVIPPGLEASRSWSEATHQRIVYFEPPTNIHLTKLLRIADRVQ